MKLEYKFVYCHDLCFLTCMHLLYARFGAKYSILCHTNATLTILIVTLLYICRQCYYEPHLLDSVVEILTTVHLDCMFSAHLHAVCSSHGRNR